MANTTVVAGQTIQVTGLNADWSALVDVGKRITISSIQYTPSGADIFIIHDRGIDGVELFHVKCADDKDQRIKYFNPAIHVNPVIDITDCTLVVAANAVLTFTLA